MKRIYLFLTGFAMSALSATAQVVAPAKSATQVKDDLEVVLNNAIGLFDGIVPVVIAVLALGIIIHFVKKVRKS